jgi:hypothetical protein
MQPLKISYQFLTGILAAFLSGILVGFIGYMTINAIFFPLLEFVIGWTLMGTVFTTYLLFKQRFENYAKGIKAVRNISALCLFALAFILPSNSSMVNRGPELQLKKNLLQLDQMLQKTQAEGQAYPANAQVLTAQAQAYFQPPLPNPKKRAEPIWIMDFEQYQAQKPESHSQSKWNVIYKPKWDNAHKKITGYTLLGSTEYGHLLSFSKSGPFEVKSPE